MNWVEVSKCNPQARRLADRHYSRQKPGSKELGPPGQKIVLLTADGNAVWGSHRPAPWAGIGRMDGFEGHSCFLFRNEGPILSSNLINEAVAYTAQRWGLAPFITYVAVDKIKSSNPGYCYLKAGWEKVGLKNGTKHGRMLRLELSADKVAALIQWGWPGTPEAEAPCPVPSGWQEVTW